MATVISATRNDDVDMYRSLANGSLQSGDCASFSGYESSRDKPAATASALSIKSLASTFPWEARLFDSGATTSLRQRGNLDDCAYNEMV
jgi:hypothetical protein